ncbi:MAG: TIGR03936 family radical SAM-associated protein [Anaerolineae bacterium]|nr:DUF2344 domain-containing protein [Chloroflexota bacterium]
MTIAAEPTRLRIIYGVDSPLCYTSVLDMTRHWERLVRRAGLPLAYTQGFHPQPRLLFAAPLPVGYRSICERLDLFLAQPCELQTAADRLTPQMPQGLAMLDLSAVPWNSPPLQSLVQEATYRVDLWGSLMADEVRRAVEALLERPSIPRQRERQGKLQQYDLRALFSEVRLLDAAATVPNDRPPQHSLLVQARCGSQGSGRPEELLEELALPLAHYRITRTSLIWQPPSGEVQP